jgi:transcriptional regulator with XRE-family HTH domain
MPENAFGQRIKVLREGLGLTQDQVSDLVGVKVAQVSRWELGKAHPSLPLHYNRLAIALKTTTAVLLNEATIDDPMGRMKQLCEVEEQAHKLAASASNETWIQFLEALRRVLKDSEGQDAARERFTERQERRRAKR